MRTGSGTMMGLWLEQGVLSFQDNLPIPVPAHCEALVQVDLAGICNTDLELIKGYYPFKGIPGHEFVGTIVRSEDEPGRVGERVVGEINASCDGCHMCRAGLPRHCLNRTVLGIVERNGAFAEYLTLPLRNLQKVPNSVENESAVFTEPLAAAIEILDQVHILPTQMVILIGAGKLGQLLARVLATTGCKLLVVARHEFQKKLLIDEGIHCCDECSCPFGQADVVVEATGSPGGLDLAIKSVRPKGSIVLKSTYAGKTTVDFSALVVNEISIIGSRCGAFEPALRLLQQGFVDPRLLVSEVFPLREGIRAFHAAGASNKLKVLLQIT